ncbi:MAG: adenine deaminase [archaeon]
MKIGGNVVDVLKGQVFPAELEVENGKIRGMTKVLKDFDTYIIPGLVDAHIHIESSLLTPSRFAEAVLPHGTVAVVSDPHEIANVLGIKGVEFMIDDAKKSPLKVFFTAPSSVPSTPFETSGAILDLKAVTKLLRKKAVVALGEVKNVSGIINDDPELVAKIGAAKKLKKPVDGHCPMLSGDSLKKYVDAGISTDHESTSYDEAREKAELGMKIMIREGSYAKSLEDLLSIAKNEKYVCFLVSDNMSPHDLVEGHVNLMLRKLVSLGVEPVHALRMATLNPIEHYRLDVGLLRKGDAADFVVVNNLREFRVLETWVKGVKVAENGKSLFISSPASPVNVFDYNDKFDTDFRLRSLKPFQRVKVIGVGSQFATNESTTELNVLNNSVQNDTSIDVLKLAVVERYGKNNIGVAFVKGFSLFDGAMASSVAHDSHNVVVVGTNDKDMASAVNYLKMIGGGFVVFYEGKVVADLKLPVAGLMSDQPADVVAGFLEKVDNEARLMGCKFDSPFMKLSSLSSLVSPKLRLSDKGLFDVEKFDFTNLFIE